MNNDQKNIFYERQFKETPMTSIEEILHKQILEVTDKPQHLQASDVEFSLYPNVDQDFITDYRLSANITVTSTLRIAFERVALAESEAVKQDLRLALFNQVYGEIRHQVQEARFAARAGHTGLLTAALDAIEACTIPSYGD